MVGAEFDDASVDSVDEGDAGAIRMSANRNLYTNIRDAAGNERGVNVDSSNQLLVVEASASAIATDAAAIEVLLTAANADHAANEVLLTGIDADTDAIKTSVATSSGYLYNIDNAVGTSGSTGPPKSMSVSGTLVGGNLKEVLVDGDGHLQVDALSSALPSGAATAANQATVIGHVDGVETLLGTIDSDTDATKTATEASQAALEKMLYGNALVITAVHGGDTQALGATYESLYVGVGGDVVVTMVGTGNFTFKNLASGQLLPIRFTHVINTNTTATYMIALKA